MDDSLAVFVRRRWGSRNAIGASMLALFLAMGCGEIDDSDLFVTGGSSGAAQAGAGASAGSAGIAGMAGAGAIVQTGGSGAVAGSLGLDGATETSPADGAAGAGGGGGLGGSGASGTSGTQGFDAGADIAPSSDAAADAIAQDDVDAGQDQDAPDNGICPSRQPISGEICNVLVNWTSCFYGPKYCVCYIATWVCVP
jgi:hypothetical protein